MRTRIDVLAALPLAAALGCGHANVATVWNPLPRAAELAPPGRTYRWSFDATSPGTPSRAFLEALGRWRAEEDAAAPSAP
jgi:hypothetical protein